MKNLNENAKNLANESVKSSVFSLFGRESEIAKSKKDILHSDFFENYAPVYYFAILCSFALLVASAISEFSFFEGLLAPKAKNPILLIALTFACVVSLETAKYYILGSTFKQAFAIGKSDLLPFFFAFSLLLSGLSMYGSVVGGGKLGIDSEKPIAVETKHDSEISQIRSEIKDIKARNTWKGNTWIVGKEKALLQEKEAFLAKTQSQKETELAQVQSENQANETTFSWVFGGLEVMFWVVMAFVWYFRKRVAIESVLESPDDRVQLPYTQVNLPDDRVNSTPDDRVQKLDDRVTYVVGNGVRHCHECHVPYLPSAKKQRFCSNPCRDNHKNRKNSLKKVRDHDVPKSGFLRPKKKKGVESATNTKPVDKPVKTPVDLPKNGAKINGAKPQITIFPNQ